MKKILYVLILTLLLTGCGKTDDNKFAKYEDSNTSIVDTIKESEVNGENEFANIMVIDDNTLETQFGITTSDVVNYVAQSSYELDARMYMAFKPAKDKEERVKKLTEAFISSVQNRLEMQKEMISNQSEGQDEEQVKEQLKYYDDQLEMVNNMLRTEYNGYLIYISSSDNEGILNILKSKLK